VKKIAALLMLLAVPAQAQSPAIQKKVEAPCETKMRLQLAAPASAIVVPGTQKHNLGNNDPTYVVCFEARTRGGGSGVMVGICKYTPEGTIRSAEITQVPPTSATILCGG
jgi:hypothetical protein